MVKLFGRKKDKTTANFKFDASLKLKDLPLDEYSHVTFAFKTAILRFERMLKESLLEGYITSTTLEKISRELNLANIRDLEVPESDTIRSLFSEEAAQLLAKKPAPVVEIPEPEPIPEPVPEPEPVETIVTPIVPTPEIPPAPEPVIETPTPTVSEPEPQISFSFSETPEPVPEPISKPEPTPKPASPLSPPSIPKITFPTESSPTASPPANPLASIRGHREEDRATGIAILRKQMLTELKKIRSVVSEQDQ